MKSMDEAIEVPTATEVTNVFVEVPTAVTSASILVISDEAWDRAFGAWIRDHGRSTPLSQNTEAWNHLNAVAPRLRELLERELRG